VQKTKGTKTKILDTRKTTPLLRDLEKEAVRHGGGVNHRRDLSSAILIKENHLSLFGAPKEAIRTARRYAPEALIVVEVRTIDELKSVLSERPNRVLLDNMNDETIKEAMTL